MIGITIKNSNTSSSTLKYNKQYSNSIHNNAFFWVGMKQAEAAGRKEDAITFYGLSKEVENMGRLVQHKLKDNLDPQAERRSFWKVSTTFNVKIALRTIDAFLVEHEKK